jgi:hypothetical protein
MELFFEVFHIVFYVYAFVVRGLKAMQGYVLVAKQAPVVLPVQAPVLPSVKYVIQIKNVSPVTGAAIGGRVQLQGCV